MREKNRERKWKPICDYCCWCPQMFNSPFYSFSSPPPPPPPPLSALSFFAYFLPFAVVFTLSFCQTHVSFPIGRELKENYSSTNLFWIRNFFLKTYHQELHLIFFYFSIFYFGLLMKCALKIPYSTFLSVYAHALKL